MPSHFQSSVACIASTLKNILFIIFWIFYQEKVIENDTKKKVEEENKVEEKVDEKKVEKKAEKKEEIKKVVEKKEEVKKAEKVRWLITFIS